MVFLRRICSSHPGDGEQRGQSLAALTAHGRGLDCLQPQPRQPVLRQNKLRIFRACAGAKDTQLASTRSSRAVRVSQPAVLSALLVIQFFGRVFSPPNFSKEHQKERCGHHSVAALLHYFSWCASEYFVVGRISCYVSYDNIGTNAYQWLFAEIFSLTAAVSNRIDSIRNLFIIFALDFPALENPISEKTNCCIQPSSHSSHASSSSSNQSGLVSYG